MKPLKLSGKMMDPDSLRCVLARRDGITLREADDLLAEARERVLEGGEDPEEVLMDEFGLEPDYIFDLLGDSV